MKDEERRGEDDGDVVVGSIKHKKSASNIIRALVAQIQTVQSFIYFKLIKYI